MPLVGLAWGAREMNWQQAKSESEAGSFPYPVPLIRAMEDQRNDSVPSASVIAGCLRAFALKQRVDYYEKPQGLLPSIFGTAFHMMMDKYTEDDPPRMEVIDQLPGGRVDIQEIRSGPRHKELFLKTTVDLQLSGYNAVEVSGRCDFLHEGVLVRDWKSKVYLAQSFAAPDDHFLQGNIYNWLAYENGLRPAPEIEIAYVSQSFGSRERRPALPLDDMFRYVRARLRIWAKAEIAGGLPYPIDAFFHPTAKGPAAPCSFCPVREACMAAFRQETESPF